MSIETPVASGRSRRILRLALLGAFLSALPVVGTGCSDDDDDGPTSGSGGQGGKAGSAGKGAAGGGTGGTGGNAGGGTGGSAGGGAGGSAGSGTGGSAGGGAGGGGAGGGGAGGAGGTQSEKVDVHVLAFNDFHGHLEPPPGSSGRIKLPNGMNVNAGGAAYFAHHIKALRAGVQHSVVVSAGDLIGASPLISGLFYNEPTIEAMNMIGLDFNGVGNHEFDKGTVELLRMKSGGCHPTAGCQDGTPFAGANFDFLAANVVDTAAGTTIFPAYKVREFDGVKVAFIGMTLEGTPSIVTPAGIAGLSFKDEVETVNALVPQIQAQGIETIVVLLHEGGLPTGFYDECPGISGPIVDIATNMSSAVDVIASGHTHEAYNCVIAGKLVTSGASFGRIVTDIDLQIDRVTGDVASKAAKNVIVTRETEDPEVAGFVNVCKEAAAPLANRQVGTITANFTTDLPPTGAGLSTMGAFIADTQLAATQPAAAGSAQIAFMNPGGVRGNLVYAAAQGEASDGIVTFGETFTVQPFGNSLVVMTLTGAQIDTLLEQQFQAGTGGQVVNNVLQVSKGFTYSYSTSAPVGSKVDFASIRLNGAPLDAAAKYRVTVNSYLASGGDSFSVLPLGTERLGGPLDLEAFEAYFAAHSPASPPALDRITALP